MKRIYLSPPHMSGKEEPLVHEAFTSNWIAPLGPHVDAFEEEFANAVGSSHAVALSSGTAALHLSLLLAGVEAGDEVLVSTLTFSASVNPILYLGARPVFLDSEKNSWNLDPGLLEAALRSRASRGRRTAAVVAVHLYGQCADIDRIVAICREYGVPLVEDAAEALGASYRSRHPGTFGQSGIFSFNGNKIITTSGGGMLATEDARLASRARKLASQARDPAPHYEHSEVGYNYRLSNILAAIGRGQLSVLEDRVQAKRRIFSRYVEQLGDIPGISFQPEASWGRHTRWLTCILIDPEAFGGDKDAVRTALDEAGAEARPLWKPMHMQPVFAGCDSIGGSIAEGLFDRGLCLPSGSSLAGPEQDLVVAVIRRTHERLSAGRPHPALSGSSEQR